MKIYRFNPRFTGFHIVSKFMTKTFNLFAFKKAKAITIFPFVFYSNRYVKMHFIEKNRHMIYIHQQMECGLVGVLIYIISVLLFSLWLLFLPVIFLWCIIYVLNYIVNIFRSENLYYCKNMLAFTREANHYANISNYTILRRPFTWMKFLIY